MSFNSCDDNAEPAPLFVEQLRRHAAEIAGAPAIRAPGGERTMAGLVDRAETIAARLRQEGCRPGDRIAVIGNPSLAWLDVMLGALFARCAIVPLSTSLTERERETLLADAGPSLVFAEPTFSRGCPDGITERLDELEAWIDGGTGIGAPAVPEGDDLFSVIYSSGTTGVPKGIAHTARSRTDFIAARARPGFGQGRVALVVTSLYTNLSFLGILSPLYFGAAASVPGRFSAAGFLDTVAGEGITDVSLVPVQVKRILDHPDFDPAKLESLQFTMVSGSPMDSAFKARLAAVWPGRVVDAYGSTETGGIATLDLKAHSDKLASVGPIMAGVDAAILGEDCKPLAVGEIGEIAARTPLPMDGYYNRDDLTEQATWRGKEGRPYIKTGDVGYIDGDGFLYITGRSRDMIISGGLNIYASDIEAVICEHPEVEEAAVIAVPDEQWGESPFAIVVPRTGSALTAEKLMQWLELRVARTSRPKGIKFVESLPRNDLGKVLKRELREPHWKRGSADLIADN